MKVVIFAGGMGTRLGSVTETIPKPMVNVGGHPLIWHIMKIYSHYGFNDFVICLGYKQEVIKEYFYNYDISATDFSLNLGSKKKQILNNHAESKWKITLINTGLKTLKGGRLKRVEKYVDKGLNLLTYGDGVSDINLKELVKFHKSHKKILTITGVHPPSRFGEIIVKNAKAVSFIEKPQTSVGLINGGFCVFDDRIFKYLRNDEECDLEYETFGKLVQLGQVMVYNHFKNWECIDTERDLKYLNKLWDEGKAFWKLWEK